MGIDTDITPFESGTAVIVANGSKQEFAQVINVSGEKVFVRLFAGKIGAFDKSQCTPLPIVPDIKAGDKVKAPKYGYLAEAVVTKVDEKIGRVFIKFPNTDKEEAIAFGNLMK